MIEMLNCIILYFEIGLVKGKECGRYTASVLIHHVFIFNMMVVGAYNDTM